MPGLLTKAFFYSEDRKFYEHGGVDWKARIGALYQNAVQQKIVRGASTITKQVVRLVNPRALEFGRDSILNLPVQTAAKTGTSTDYRDAWSVGFNDRYKVGLWMGNLDRTTMGNVTGSTGPALAMLSIFNILNKSRDDTKDLYLSPALIEKPICTRPSSQGTCPTRVEYFVEGHRGWAILCLPPPRPGPSRPSLELVRPTEGLIGL